MKQYQMRIIESAEERDLRKIADRYLKSFGCRTDGREFGCIAREQQSFEKNISYNQPGKNWNLRRSAKRYKLSGTMLIMSALDFIRSREELDVVADLLQDSLKKFKYGMYFTPSLKSCPKLREEKD